MAIVHSYYSSRQPSGENIVVDAQARALRSEGLEVEVVAARTDELESERGYQVRSAVNVATGFGPSPIALLRDFAPDVVHVHNLFPNWGTRWLHEWSGPVVATVHNFRPVCAAGTLFRDGRTCMLCPESGTLNAVRHACYRGSRIATVPLAVKSRIGVRGDPLLSRADRVIVLSPRARSLYESFGLAPEKTIVIPNFVEDIGFKPGRPPGEDWVYIGRLSEEKGIVGLLSNWPDGERLTVFGDGPLRPAVEEAASRHPLVEYRGPITRDRVPEVLASGRGLVFPSEWAEGFPTVYAEALAAGRPVVARQGNSAADDIAESSTGTVFEDWADLPTALRAAMDSAEFPLASNRSRYEEAFTPSAWLRRIGDEYRRLTRKDVGSGRA